VELDAPVRSYGFRFSDLRLRSALVQVSAMSAGGHASMLSILGGKGELRCMRC